MKKIIRLCISLFFTRKNIAQFLAGIIADLLRKASKSGKWDLIKAIVQRVEEACHLFNECYEDDNMDKEEEDRIAEVIEHIADDIKG